MRRATHLAVRALVALCLGLALAMLLVGPLGCAHRPSPLEVDAATANALGTRLDTLARAEERAYEQTQRQALDACPPHTLRSVCRADARSVAVDRHGPRIRQLNTAIGLFLSAQDAFAASDRCERAPTARERACAESYRRQGETSLAMAVTLTVVLEREAAAPAGSTAPASSGGMP